MSIPVNAKFIDAHTHEGRTIFRDEYGIPWEYLNGHIFQLPFNALWNG